MLAEMGKTRKRSRIRRCTRMNTNRSSKVLRLRIVGKEDGDTITGRVCAPIAVATVGKEDWAVCAVVRVPLLYGREVDWLGQLLHHLLVVLFGVVFTLPLVVVVLD